MSDQTYSALCDELSTPLTDKGDLMHLLDALIDIGVDRITVLTADNKTVTIEPATHLSLNDFVKAMNGE